MYSESKIRLSIDDYKTFLNILGHKHLFHSRSEQFSEQNTFDKE